MRLASRWFWLVILAGVMSARGQSTTTAPAEAKSDTEALKGLEGHLSSLAGIKTLEVEFTCEKRLAMLDSPLVSSGRLWIKGGDKGNAVRFSTQVPYVSELILAEGKTYARSQHETSWTSGNQSSRPGLTAVMLQLGGWSTGQTGKLETMYAVNRPQKDAQVPARPGAAKGEGGGAAELFELTPVDKDLAVAVKRVMLGMEKGVVGVPSRLSYLEITTAQDDVTRYWFYGGKVNGELPADIFKPVDVKP
jgi:hypothetical protein